MEHTRLGAHMERKAWSTWSARLGAHMEHARLGANTQGLGQKAWSKKPVNKPVLVFADKEQHELNLSMC